MITLPTLAFRDPLGINKTAPLPEGSCHAGAEGRECYLRPITARVSDVALRFMITLPILGNLDKTGDEFM